MRLLNVDTLQLEEFDNDSAPRYAILSHTWGQDIEEISFQDLTQKRLKREGLLMTKLRGCCYQAEKDQCAYVWIDTCCIDKTNSVELSEAINSMFRWYKNAYVCYAYLSDVPPKDDPRQPDSKVLTSRWFERGWTLQELIAPPNLRFFDSGWHLLGNKGSLCRIVQKITGIPTQYLLGTSSLHDASVAQRMSWASNRITKRKEDIAYCLLGIFNVTMPMIYGEGEQAFDRLQKAIIVKTNDDSILAWESNSFRLPQAIDSRILAISPSEFKNCGKIVPRTEYGRPRNTLHILGSFLELSLPIRETPPARTFGILSCGPETDPSQVLGIRLVSIASEVQPNEYFRPQGAPPMLVSNSTVDDSLVTVRIRANDETRHCSRNGQQYWFQVEDPIGLDLQLVEAYPESRWLRDRALIDAGNGSNDNATQRTLTRFKSTGNEAFNHFIVVLEFETRNSQPLFHCYVMTSTNKTSLRDIATMLDNEIGPFTKSQFASNFVIHLQASLVHGPTPTVSLLELKAIQHNGNHITVRADDEWDRWTSKEAVVHHSRGYYDLVRQGQECQRKTSEMKASLASEETRLKDIERAMVRLKEERRLITNHLIERKEELAQLNSARIKLDEELDEAADMVRETQDNLVVDSEAIKVGSFLPPLIWASKVGDIHIFRMILEKVDDINQQDEHGTTALIQAAESGHESIVRELIDEGADIEIRDNLGMNAKDWAVQESHAVIGKLLNIGPPLNI